MASASSSLYYLASFVHLAIIPKHLKVGGTLIRETVSKVPNTESSALPKAIIPATWDYVNGLLGIMSLINLKMGTNGWSRWEN
ncbi:hypothetical protein N7540_004466 [Penicillium herquei]|nr:hypothetical protein N7540_004466 [Penicillium herquei]